MKPVHQDRFGSPGGNCLQAALASILELPLKEVPNFVTIPGPSWWDELQAWLGRRGLTLVCVPPDADWRGWLVQYGGYHLIGGKSPRGLLHSVVGYKGAMVHDPPPDGTGLETVEDFWIFMSTLEGAAKEEG